MLRKFGWGLVIILIGVLTLLGVSIAPIDDTALDQFETIRSNADYLDIIKLESVSGDGELKAGWSAVNITPHQPLYMAGYGRRGPYKNVADSLFARTIVLDNGAKSVVIISLDLLMFPRVLKSAIEERLITLGYTKNEIFLSATHTHNGFGNWDKSIAGGFIFGEFDQDNMHYLTDKVIRSVEEAISRLSVVSTGFQKIDAHEHVQNRLAPKKGKTDPFLRIITLRKDEGQKALIVSFSGHAVNLDADIWELSRDYPGVIVGELEKEPGVEFAMFCAGMVASHSIKSDLPKGHQRILTTGKSLSSKILELQDSVNYSSNSDLSAIDIELHMPPSQLRLTQNLRLRDWVFAALLGELTANIKAVGIGKVLMIGMPCDYSGELSVNYALDQFAEINEKELFITSFNGNYIGYITEDAHYYSCDHDEVRSLNWVGPNKGGYFTEIIKDVIGKTQE